MRVVTVLGEVGCDDLGFTQVHEHVICDSGLGRAAGVDLTKVLNHRDVAVQELKEYRAAGGATVVEVTTPDFGRDPLGLRSVAEESGVNIVMGCGLYREPYYPAWVNETSTEQLTRRLVEEIETGVEDTGIRPGVIGEIGSDKSWVSGVEERVFRAVGLAQAETGLGVMTHTPPGAALAQLDILLDAGADPKRIAMGHCDSWLDFDYHVAIARYGVFLSFDLIGHAMYPDEWRARHIAELIRRGYGDRILLSSDTYMKTQLKTWGGGGYVRLRKEFLPQLVAQGVDEAQIEAIMGSNAARFLGGGP